MTTLSWSINFFAFSAKVGQSDAPSSTIASICLPSTPPALLISSIANCSASTTLFSLIAIVLLKECKIPTLMVFPLPAAGDGDALGVGEASELAVGVGLLQAFNSKLVARVAELYKRNCRRSNRFTMSFL